MFDFIFRWRQQYILRHIRKNPSKKRILGFDATKTIGIVFALKSVPQWNAIRRFAQDAENQGKEVHLLCLREQDMPFGEILSYHRLTVCLTKDDMDFWGEPRPEHIEPFLKNHFHLFVNLIDEPCFFAQYMAAKVNADTKAAYLNTSLYTEQSEHLQDFSLFVRGKDKTSETMVLDQIKEFLFQVKK